VGRVGAVVRVVYTPPTPGAAAAPGAAESPEKVGAGQ
jgi:hypothetical protein